MNTIRDSVDKAIAISYESWVESHIGGIFAPLFRRVRVQKGLFSVPNLTFLDILDDAEENGIITEEQYLEVQNLDLVLTGRRKSDGAEVYIAAEVSITIGGSDIARAAERAAILSAAIGQPVEAVVIGSQIDDARAALAADNNVAVFLSPED